MEPSSNAVDCFWGKCCIDSTQNTSITSLIIYISSTWLIIGVELSGKNKTHLFEEEGEEDLETVLELRQVSTCLTLVVRPSLISAGMSRS